jgi:hypothetical protein
VPREDGQASDQRGELHLEGGRLVRGPLLFGEAVEEGGRVVGVFGGREVQRRQVGGCEVGLDACSRGVDDLGGSCHHEHREPGGLEREQREGVALARAMLTLP